jgi:DNA-binding transcriptional LysR family regulator
LQYGISILPQICIDNNPNIRYVKLEGEALTRQVVLATAKDRYISPASDYFVTLVKDQYQIAQ